VSFIRRTLLYGVSIKSPSLLEAVQQLKITFRYTQTVQYMSVNVGLFSYEVTGRIF